MRLSSDNLVLQPGVVANTRALHVAELQREAIADLYE